jgi:lipooligosaccharide transport system ATP-binding protein
MDMTLVVRTGEVVGLAGIVGAGRTELLSCLYGEGPRGRWRGTVRVQGRAAALRSVAEARRAGLAFVTDDRRGAGLMLRQTVARNVVASILRRLSPTGFMSRRREGEAVQRAIRAFDVRPPRGELVVGNLSGGNQQKVVFARELLHEPRLLLLDEPTVGLDPQVRQELWALIDRLRSEGVSILMSTHYIEEAERLCDSVTIMSHGKAVAVGAPHELIREHAGGEAIEVYGPPTRLTEVEADAAARGWRTRRTGTSVAVLHGNGAADLAGERRVTNLEDVFVLLTGEEIT